MRYLIMAPDAFRAWRIAEFWARVDQSRGQTACWPWSGALAPNGYGFHQIHNRKRLTHRLAYELAKGEISAGLLVLHRCDNRRCCNPAHLFLGTQSQNMADMDRKGRRITGYHVKGEKHPRIKYSTDIAKTIRAAVLALPRRPNGWIAYGALKGIRQQFGISLDQARRIANGRSRKALLF